MSTPKHRAEPTPKTSEREGVAKFLPETTAAFEAAMPGRRRAS